MISNLMNSLWAAVSCILSVISSLYNILCTEFDHKLIFGGDVLIFLCFENVLYAAFRVFLVEICNFTCCVKLCVDTCAFCMQLFSLLQDLYDIIYV